MKIAYVGLLENISSILEELERKENEIFIFDKNKSAIELVSEDTAIKNVQDGILGLIEFLLERKVVINYNINYVGYVKNENNKIDICCKNDVFFLNFDRVVE